MSPLGRGLRLAVWGAVFGLPVVLLWRCASLLGADAIEPRTTGATLVEEAFTVRFEPGKGAGVPMRLDWADTRPFAHTKYFERFGYRNQPTESQLTKTALERMGFPYLTLVWPSLHMPDAPLCLSAAGLPQDSCPAFDIALESVPARSGTERLIPGEVWQWTAFHTRRAGGRAEWAGWQCDAVRQQQMNREIGAPDAARRQWALHPLLLQARCSSPAGFLERRLPALAGFEEHAVVWTCGAAADDNARFGSGECLASFTHAGRRVTLRLPGAAWTGDAEHRMPPLLQLRPQLVEAAWRTLEDAAAAARKDAPAPEWQAPLAREMAWCNQYAARTAELRRAGRATEAREAWSRGAWRLGTSDNRGPCARAFHRVLRVLENLPEDGKPPAPLVAAARGLAEIETSEVGYASRPVWALAKDLIARDAGARSMVLLQWRLQQQWQRDDADEALAHYDALREQVAQLPAKERLALRRAIASSGASSGPLAERSPELRWEFARDWLQSPGVLELNDEERMWTLLQPAQHARRLPPDEANARLELLVPAMQAEARRIAQDPQLLTQTKLVYVATLSLHAAWHANRLVLQSAEPTRWKDWLVQHAAWTETALPLTPRDWVTGVALHRDAALKGRATEPDCPGASALRCGWAYQPAPLVMTGVVR